MVPLFLFGAEAQAGTVTANVVAMDQVLIYNRLGVFNPAGMIFALARDVFPLLTDPDNQDSKFTGPFDLAHSCAVAACTPGNVQLRPDKRPRPLTLRANEGDTLEITLTNLLNNDPIPDANNEQPPGIQVPDLDSEQPKTRNVSIHIHGMQWANGAGDDGSNVGTQNSLVAPGGFETYKLYAEKEGAYTITSGPNLGGQGGSGALANGLFGVLNVEPAGSEWYRSQVTREEMEMATTGYTDGGQPIINYDAVYSVGHPYAGKPILNIVNNNEIFHNELNAIITGPGRTGFSGEPSAFVYPNRGEPFREFTVIFHDEIKVVQAFPGWFEDTDQGFEFTLGSVKDGFAINYGTGGIGAEIIGNRLGVGPMWDCPECKYEEFFLTSWAVGDPAMIVDIPANADLENLAPGGSPGWTGPKATKAFYPDDPSNVWHGYLNDRTKIRNIHVGTEHHIYHLHAHQWLFAPLDPDSGYVDAQALGPASSFTYEIVFGGGGNRNKTAGDSIFHCHFYPHFAQGMWGLWRVHDTFEMGSVLDHDGRVLERGLPDSEICSDADGNPVYPTADGAQCGGYDSAGYALKGGTATPGVVPIPTKAMAPMPGSFVASVDHDNNPATPDADVPFMGYPFYIPGVAGHRPPTPPMDLLKNGGLPRHVITDGTVHAVQTPLNFEKELVTATGFQLPEDGTPAEKAAMAFHGPQPGPFHSSYKPEDGSSADFEVNGLPPVMGAPYADPCRSNTGDLIGNPRAYKASVIELDVQFNKVGWHFNQQRIIVLDDDVGATLAGSRAPEPFVMRANTNDCVNFDHTNLVPSVYQQDDYQVKTPTDVIGQHIHLVKFDVTSSDGSANGWNYEDGTLSPDEVAERIHALTARGRRGSPGGSWDGDKLGKAGPRTTRQRWFIDTGWTGNVFTHDHYGPSTHQQAGLYATLLVEPENSTWRDSETGMIMGSRPDGGPTSWRADILNGDDSYREFYLEFADFQLAYRDRRLREPVNPPGREEVGLPFILERGCPPPFPEDGPCPEAISAEDPGTFVVNYRNEPIALRVRDPRQNRQADGLAGDLAFAFSSLVTRADNALNTNPNKWPYSNATASSGALAGDPFTPILRVYEGDQVFLRVQVGAHEEGHNFSINGIKWLESFSSPYSGYRNSQMMGISEYFMFQVPAMGRAEGAAKGMKHDDYRYLVGSSTDAMWNGAWGIMRAYEGNQDVGLQYLPNNPDGELPGAPPPPDQRACPTDDDGNFFPPPRQFSIAAVRAADVLPDLDGDLPGDPGFDGGTLWYNPGNLDDPTALLYVLTEDLVLDGQGNPIGLVDGTPVEPLILRAAAGDCIEVELHNMLPEELHGPDPNFPGQTADLAGFNTLPMIVDRFNANQVRPSSHVGLHSQLVGYAVAKADGMNVGTNEWQTAGPGETVTYHWYAGDIQTDSEGNPSFTPMEFGAINLMPADSIKHSNKGLVGALIIEPEEATWIEDPGTRASATVAYPDGIGGEANFRDFVIVMQDDINMRCDGCGDDPVDPDAVPIVSDEEDPEDSGMKAINYRTDPIWLRLRIGPTADPDETIGMDFTNAFASPEPVTPIFTASPGQEVRFRVLKPGGHNRNHVFTLHGHLWARHPFNDGSTQIYRDNPYTFWHGEQMGHGPTNHVNVVPLHGAGGKYEKAGDYLYRDMAPVHVYNGIWGIFRVQ
jgi:hypothetical protein